jgi:hypothetical protein
LYPKVVLLSKKQFSRNFLLELVEKTKQLYVLPTLANYYLVTNFDLWMSKGAYDIFPPVINLFEVD